jgi:surfeit locus 1 family protein
VILVMLATAFTWLGIWQLERKAEKQALFDAFDAAPELGIEQALQRQEPFVRVEAFGRYEPERHVLLDNRIFNGRAGVHALSPFRLGDGRSILVNRGWLPLAPDRRTLPAVPTGADPRTIRGRLVSPPAAGQRLGAPDVLVTDHWPQLVTYLDIDTVAAALETPLENWILHLDADDDSGFGDRQWQPAVMTPAVHGAYALQWLALAMAAVVIWLLLGFRRGRAPRPPVAGGSA